MNPADERNRLLVQPVSTGTEAHFHPGGGTEPHRSPDGGREGSGVTEEPRLAAELPIADKAAETPAVPPPGPTSAARAGARPVLSSTAHKTRRATAQEADKRNEPEENTAEFCDRTEAAEAHRGLLHN